MPPRVLNVWFIAPAAYKRVDEFPLGWSLRTKLRGAGTIPARIALVSAPWPARLYMYIDQLVKLLPDL